MTGQGSHPGVAEVMQIGIQVVFVFFLKKRERTQNCIGAGGCIWEEMGEGVNMIEIHCIKYSKN